MTADRPSPSECLVDFSYARPTPGEVPHAGIVSYVSSTPAKNLPRNLAQAFLAAGKTVNLVCQNAKDGALGARRQGTIDALLADAQADWLGAPDWLPIVYAVDFDATPAQLAGPVADYFRGAVERSKRPVGAYGGVRTIDYLAGAVPQIVLWWQTVAWSAGRVSPHAHLLQQAGARWYPIPGLATDDNQILKPFPRWGQTEEPDMDYTPLLTEIRDLTARLTAAPQAVFVVGVDRDSGQAVGMWAVSALGTEKLRLTGPEWEVYRAHWPAAPVWWWHVDLLVRPGESAPAGAAEWIVAAVGPVPANVGG